MTDKAKKASDAMAALVGKTKMKSEGRSPALLILLKHTFPFERLPPELRNNIYRLVLVTVEGPIEITGHINVEKRGLKRQPCTCCTTIPSKCARCTRLEETETYKLEVKTLAIQANKCRRKPLMKKAYGGAIISVNRQAHKEAAAILYGENAFVFGCNAVFQRFCTKIGRKIALLRNIEIQSLTLPSQCGAFSILPAECKLERIKIGPSDVKYVDLKDIFRLVRPFITKPGTQGCRCMAPSNGRCHCRTAEQKRLFACVDISTYDNYLHWDYSGGEDRTASVLLERAWNEYVSRKVKGSDQGTAKDRRRG
ncbi:hypothetical protein B0A54_04450 [Friedmanniomyces endolithicus]|uniref:Uncharacterized protein n=1 Tax=Friedmanniomyces endolithicus TaxID=329885 RepID=A0A4U0V945_9PEZI|nr:hypothetical protein LTS09_010744 [Friedmanniomyces endolithicus]TKA45354.1 hypothetical protein B0A54_04450 [Friedmanniomyces endolithicus]